MTDDTIERMVGAAHEAVCRVGLERPWDENSTNRVIRACLAAALRSLVSNKPTLLDGRGIILTGSALDATVIVIEGLADRLEKSDG